LEILTPSASNVYWFGGQYGSQWDVSNRYYVRARHLETANGRWISRDPIAFDTGDLNLYRFVANNPAVFIDPTGMEYCSPPPLSSCDQAKQYPAAQKPKRIAREEVGGTVQM